MQERPSFIDPEQLARMGDLRLAARFVVDGLMMGLHRSPNSGTSIEFDQYRPYAQGDDLRHVDWRLYGRTDRLHIKLFQDETNLRCTLLLDCSGSMDYGSGGIAKFDYARMLAASLVTILQRQRDEAGLVAYHEDLVSYLPARASASHRHHIFAELARLEPQGATDTARALHYLGDVLPPRGMVILISDLLQPLEEVINRLRTLRARRHDVIVFQISDPAEQTFPFSDTATFVDAESGAEQYAVPDAVREQYLENRRQHFDVIKRECLVDEVELTELVTNEPLDRAMLFFLKQRAQALMTTSRARGAKAAGSAS